MTKENGNTLMEYLAALIMPKRIQLLKVGNIVTDSESSSELNTNISEEDWEIIGRIK